VTKIKPCISNAFLFHLYELQENFFVLQVASCSLLMAVAREHLKQKKFGERRRFLLERASEVFVVFLESFQVSTLVDCTQYPLPHFYN
jgi:hypothetical protein